MHKNQFSILFLGIILLLTGCKTPEESGAKVRFNVLHINDVYEISALEKGKVGGMARVATLRKSLLEETPNTLTLLAGDFLNPSGMGQVIVDGRKLLGSQMVDVMNQTGVDFVTFGNHEFDLKEAPLLERIDMSEFGWISANVLHYVDSTEVPFTHKGKDIPPYEIVSFQDDKGNEVKMGIISVTLLDNMPAYTRFSGYLDKAKEAYEAASKEADFVIALTHLEMEEDVRLAEEIPGLKVVMGGHEHTYHYQKVGDTEVCKADANAKSAWVYRFTWDTKTKSLGIEADTLQLRDKIAEDPEIAKVVEDWTAKVFDALRTQGFNPDSVVATVSDSLDGLESSNRDHQTNLGELIAASMQAVWPGAEFGLLNAGSIRIDDLVEGEVTQYDIIRILPFGGSTVKVTMPGDMLEKMLNIGSADSLKGNGGFLQYAGVEKQPDGSWKVGDAPLDQKKKYTFAGGDYLMQFETAYVDLYEEYKGKYTITAGKDPLQVDIRMGLIDYMSKMQ